MSTVQTIFITIGLLCVVGAVIGGGFEMTGMKLPKISSLLRQIMLFLVGVVLTVIGLWADRNSDLYHRLFGAPEEPPAVELVDESFRMTPEERTHISRDIVFCYWNITSFVAGGGPPADMQTRYQEENRDLKLKLNIFRRGQEGASCDELGSFAPLLRQGQSIPVPHPICELHLTVRDLRRRIRPEHSWEDFLQAGREHRDRSAWFDSAAELRLTGSCRKAAPPGVG